MPRFVYDEYGSRWLEGDDGQLQIANEGSALAFAGKKIADFGNNIALALGGDEAANRTALSERDRLFQPAQDAQPIANFVGEMLPTAPLMAVGAGGYAANALLQMGLGAAEGALSYDEGTTAGGRALGGAVGALVGDAGGRMLGRVVNSARGLARDLRGRGKAPAANPDAQAFEEMGGTTLAHQRMAPGSPGQRLAERSARGVEAGPAPPGMMQAAAEANDAVTRQYVADAVGVPVPGRLDDVWRADVINAMDARYAAIDDVLETVEPMALSESAARRIVKSPQVKDAMADGAFPGLMRPEDAPDDWVPMLSGTEYREVREILAEDAANKIAGGQGNWGRRIYDNIDELDQSVADQLPAGFQDEYARVREQTRNFKLLEKPNVINTKGQVNIQSLNRVLKSGVGYGRGATARGQVRNPETRSLLDWAQAADRPEFKAFQTSGTAENLAAQDAMTEGAGAASELLTTGNVVPALGLAGRLGAGRVVSMANTGQGALFQGMATPAPVPMTRAGAAVGRSFIDEALYPFVGQDDDRRY